MVLGSMRIAWVCQEQDSASDQRGQCGRSMGTVREIDGDSAGDRQGLCTSCRVRG